MTVNDTEGREVPLLRFACNEMVGWERLTILGEGIATCRSSGFASSRVNSCRLNAGDRCSKHD